MELGEISSPFLGALEPSIYNALSRCNNGMAIALEVQGIAPGRRGTTRWLPIPPRIPE
jgi:hypothetical protein